MDTSFRTNIVKWLPRAPEEVELFLESASKLSLAMTRLSRKVASFLKKVENHSTCGQNVRFSFVDITLFEYKYNNFFIDSLVKIDNNYKEKGKINTEKKKL